jgi:nicotinamidase-related amidase
MEIVMSKYLEVLTPQNSQLLFIDQQPQMAFGVQSIDRQNGDGSAAEPPLARQNYSLL